MNHSTHICKNCQNAFEGNYCNRCGQKRFTPHDKSILHILEEGFHFVTHFEGNFFTTAKTMATKPGKFSLDYCNGVQQRYFRPLSFFLLLVVVYLLFPLFDGLNVSLKIHTTGQWYSTFAAARTLRLMTEHHLSEEYTAEHFHAVSGKVSKLLLFLIIPVMAGWTVLLTARRKDKQYFDHFIFSTEINSLLVLWGFLVLPLLVLLFLTLKRWLLGAAAFNDGTVSLFLVASLLVYVLLAARRFFHFRWLQAGLFAVLYIGLYVFLVQYVYKFFLFWISINLVR